MVQRKKKDKRNSLSIERLTLLRDIFDDKEWDRAESDSFSEYNVFCEMLTCLADEEQDLVLSITKNFLWIGDLQYFVYFRKAFNMLAETIIPAEGGRLFISPLLREADIGKTKSSNYLYYKVKSEVDRLQRGYDGHRICLIDGVKALCDPMFLSSEKPATEYK